MELMALLQEELVFVLENTSLSQNKVFAFLSREVFVFFLFLFPIQLYARLLFITDQSKQV